MSIFKGAVSATLMLAMASTSALAAGEAIRPSMSLASPGTRLALPAAKTGTRLGGHVGEQTNLFGAPLFLLFLGAVTITIGTIIIVNNNNNPTSP